MEFAAICAVAIFLGVRGFRASGRTYAWCAVVVAAATLYTYRF